MKKERIKVTLLSKEKHLVLNPLMGKKTFLNSKSLFWHLDSEVKTVFDNYSVKTPAKAIGVYEASAQKDVSLKEMFEFFPGVLSRKWLSQSQVLKVCKHFRDWLVFDGYTYFLCKKRENLGVNLENPWQNLVIVEIELDHENDLALRLVSPLILESNCVLAKKYRVILPKRTKEQKI